MSLNLTPSQLCPKPYPTLREKDRARLLLLVVALLLLAATLGVFVHGPIHVY